MVSLIKRPIGHKLDVTAHEATTFDYAGDVGIYTGVGHGLVDGDYVYVDSNIDAYNGFKYVDSVNYDTFKLKESENGDYVPFKQAVTINFYISVLNHYWQCVHLPIVYELESDIFPNNTGEETYQPNTVISFSENAGYVQLNLNQALSDPEELSRIEVVGGTLAGVYQIVTVVQPWSVVIDLAYDAGYSFSGSVIVKYYDNYAINVNVYAGLESGHPWEAEKPFELAATLKFIPDSDNKIKFSIAEILKGYIETRNKLDLNTLPNNTDFMVSFYIGYFETYDQSDGEEITTFTGAVTSDTEIGYATNSKLEFKNLYSGHMSDYVSTEDHVARWLTTFERPIIVIGQFFDISFINAFDGNITITNFKSTLGSTDEEITEIVNPGKGILRIPLVGESGYVQYCIQASTVGQAEIPGVTSPVSLPPLSDGVNIPGAFTDWTTGANPSVNLNGGGFKRSDIWANNYDFIEGYEYDCTPDLDFSLGAGAVTQIIFVILDASNNVLFTQTFDLLPGTSGTFTNPINFMGIPGMAKYGFRITSTSISPTNNSFDLDSFTATQTTPSTPAVDPQIITEQLCIEVINECDSTSINDNLRLTEGNNLRALE